jgi:hypothetical protein
VLHNYSCATLQAFLTLFVWGFIHFTFIVNAKDCLLNATERPIPQDTIVQVEVYANTSEIWRHREKALKDMFNKMYDNRIQDRRPVGRSDAWIRDYCGTSFLINLTGTNFFCQLILAEFFRSLEGSSTVVGDSGGVTTGAEDAIENNNTLEGDMEYDVAADTGEDVKSYLASPTTARENFFDVVVRGGCCHDKDYVDSTATLFYSKNYTLYDLFEFYSKLLHVNRW